MKIHFDNVNINARTGPNSFAKRLAHELTKRNHQVYIGDGSNCDVSLVFIEPSGLPLAKKVIQRLDGIWYAPNEYHTKNVRIKKLYDEADHVIWQSSFSRRVITGFWGEPRVGSVICNGAEKLNHVDDDLQRQLDVLRQKHEVIMTASANWHRQKRLEENIRVFDRVKQKYSTACLIIMGADAKFTPQRDVYYIGSVSHEACMQIYRASDWMIHLGWLDHCPNVVIEALINNVPVICTEDGGTPELVCEYGIILKETKPYDFGLVEYDDPPPLDIEGQFSGALPTRSQLGKRRDLSIELSAIQYIDVMSKLVSDNND